MLSGSNQNIGFEPIFGFEVILNTPSDLDCIEDSNCFQLLLRGFA